MGEVQVAVENPLARCQPAFNSTDFDINVMRFGDSACIERFASVMPTVLPGTVNGSPDETGTAQITSPSVVFSLMRSHIGNRPISPSWGGNSISGKSGSFFEAESTSFRNSASSRFVSGVFAAFAKEVIRVLAKANCSDCCCGVSFDTNASISCTLGCAPNAR